MLKVGDKVKIKKFENWVRDPADPGVCSEMKGYCGMEVTISKVVLKTDGKYVCNIAEDSGAWIWYPVWFEGVDSVSYNIDEVLKFKVGDKVAVRLSGSGCRYDGRVGTITTVESVSDDSTYCVEYDDSDFSCQHESTLISIM